MTCATDDINKTCNSLGSNQCRDPITSICFTTPASRCADPMNYNNCLDISSRTEYCISQSNMTCEILNSGVCRIAGSFLCSNIPTLGCIDNLNGNLCILDLTVDTQ